MAKPAPTAAAGWPWRVLIMWLVLAAVLLLVNAQGIVLERFGDPDDALRLVEVRDLLGGQSWFDVHQYRIAPPEGVAMHWSRLVDIPLATGILVLRPLLGDHLAELVTVVMVPLLTLLCTLMLIGRLAARFFDAETVGIACLVTGIAGPLLFQMTPLRIDHHGWQIVLALAALNGLSLRDPVRGGLVVGGALAALLAISIEGLPLTVVFLGVLALRGLLSPKTGFTGLFAAAATLALAGIGIFLGTRGTADLATHCDQISPVHLALFAWIALGTGVLAFVAPRRLSVALPLLGVIGAGTLALFLGAAPQCKGGAFVALDPMVRKYWYEGVSEGMPFWRLPMANAAETLLMPLIGLIATALLWRDARSQEERLWWRDHALVLAGAWLIGLMVSRAGATACGFAAVPTAAVALRWIVALRDVPPARRIAGYLGIMLMLLPPLPVVAWNRVSGLLAAPSATPQPMTMSGCRYAQAAQALDKLPPTDLFAPLDIGPDLILRTHDTVVATGHHRGSAGMRDVIAAFIGTPEEAHAIIRRRHTPLIVVCPDITEPATYIHYAPDGFMARLLKGQAPSWLEPVDLAPGSHMKFWRVKN
ncbi:hypothetical protein [Novosphingobium nitrogenifigens]|nr:hypothetical protein [Novosphingobium nitrogenifigens]